MPKLNNPIPGVGPNDTVLILSVFAGESEDWRGTMVLGRVESDDDVARLAGEAIEGQPQEDCELAHKPSYDDDAFYESSGPSCSLDCNTHHVYMVVRGDEVIATWYPVDHVSWNGRSEDMMQGTAIEHYRESCYGEFCCEDYKTPAQVAAWPAYLSLVQEFDRMSREQLQESVAALNYDLDEIALKMATAQPVSEAEKCALVALDPEQALTYGHQKLTGRQFVFCAKAEPIVAHDVDPDRFASLQNPERSSRVAVKSGHRRDGNGNGLDI